jgi:hypothetical protein
MTFPIYCEIQVPPGVPFMNYGYTIFNMLCAGYDANSVSGTSIVTSSEDKWRALVRIVSSTGPSHEELYERIAQMSGDMSDQACQRCERYFRVVALLQASRDATSTSSTQTP